MSSPYRTASPPEEESRRPCRCRLGFHKWVAVEDGLPPVTEGSGNAFGGYQIVYGRYQALNCVLCGDEALWDVTAERALW